MDPRADTADPICFAGAPFSLLHYSDARAHAREIARAAKNRVMPPWLPERAADQIGDFASPRTLTDAQIALLERWAEQGAAEGNPSDRPAVPAWPQGWQLGQPDLVLKMPRGVHAAGRPARMCSATSSSRLRPADHAT